MTSQPSESMAHSQAQKRLLLLILALYLIIGVTYILATPPLESSDEYKHYPVVQYIENEGRLPVLDPENPGRWLQSAAQPPAYYLLMALLTWGIDTTDLADIHQVNPYAFVGDTRHAVNNNLIIHQPAREAFPWHGAILAVYLIRFASLLLGLGTIIFALALGRRLASAQVGLLAAALTAANPMFLFISSAVNNDALAALVGAAGIYLLVFIWQERPEPWRRPGLFLLIGIVVGLGTVTKLSLGGLGLVAALLFGSLSWQKRSWRWLLLAGLLSGGPALLIALPMFWRNLTLYGDLTGLSAFLAVQGVRARAITWADWWSEFGTFYRTFWGLFGGLNIAAPNWFYGAANGLALFGLAGHLRNGRGPQRALAGWRRGAGGWLLLLWLLSLVILLLRWTVIYPSFQGRLLFPGLTSFNVLWAIGLWRWLGNWRYGARALGTVAGLAFVMAALLPWTHIRPAYAYPTPLTAVPSEELFGPFSFAAAPSPIELVGVALIAPADLRPDDEPVRLVLYWRATGPVDVDYLGAVSLLGIDEAVVSHTNRYPANGAIPTSAWSPGQIWRDEYELYVSPEAAAPAQLSVRVALYEPARDADLPVSDPAGNPLTLLLVGNAVLRPGEPPALPAGPAASFNGLNLYHEPLPDAAVAGQPLPIQLYWEADAPLAPNHTVFLHLLNEAGDLALAGDGPPAGGYFPTSLWQPGDIIPDLHTLQLPADLPPGNYQLAIGLYEPISGSRLLRTDGSDSLRLPLRVTAP
ncbi:MAG: glycosyltransferase family 39 protein [Anaerolineales bacterium]|nr:glycosyltransferase family 39 protein [Anaerolineales bacterium]